MADAKARDGPAAEEVSRYREPSALWRVAVLVATALAVLLAVNHLFSLQLLIGHTLLENQYFYGLAGLLVPIVFVLWPAAPGAPRDRVPWYDVALALLTLAIFGYFVANSGRIIDEGWEYSAPEVAVYASGALWLLALEAARRTGGVPILAVVLVVSLYPLYAGSLPGILHGEPTSLAEAAIFHATSSESILGIPMRAFANLVFGFLVFGVALQHSGGGRFFLDLAFALLGHVRGGPAKVAIFASGLMGSMSGSVITNVLTTGVMTIPAMRRVGFARAYAGGVETCASTGGVLMPPIMGATAFVMATFLEVPYVEIVIAAIVPSLLYFFGLFVQIDAYAARMGLAGLPREELPTLGRTIRQGWYFIAVFALLIWLLVFLKREGTAPFYATVLLIAINQVVPHHRWSGADFVEFAAATGRLLAELAAILLGIGLIVGALVVTGKLGNLANDLLRLAGGAPLVLLLMGALTSFVLGIGMTVTAAYIFLAIALAPALIRGGLDAMSVHLFILYWGMLSFITPPVALGAYAAASLAEASPMRTGFEAMRLGSIIYFIPFFFVLDPAFILHGDWPRLLYLLPAAIVGIVLLAGGLQGYVAGFGRLCPGSALEWPVRALVVLAGLLIALPGGGLLWLSKLELTGIAVVLLVPAAALAVWHRRFVPAAPG